MGCGVTSIAGNEHGARMGGRMVNTWMDNPALAEEGCVCFGKMGPIIYDSTRRIYRVVGEEVGRAWGVEKH
ncbi:MAG: hypothetical protein IJ125_07670 [Atopobiaceae bacterium]|nr:hypothetical protein [Atopobiaceae bacterium]